MDAKDYVPLHTMVTNQLIEKIEGMEYGDKLPSERELCDEFSVSRTTIRHSLEALKISGYITKVHGKGNFISTPNKNKENLLDYYSFTEQTLARNMKPADEILGFAKEIPNEAVRKGMNLQVGEKVIRINRLRFADDIPMLLEITYIPDEIFSTLTRNDLEEQPLYNIFENVYKIKIVEVIEQFSSVNIFNPDAKLLKLRENSSCLRIKRFSYDATGKVVELTYSFAHPDQFIYRRSYKV